MRNQAEHLLIGEDSFSLNFLETCLGNSYKTIKIDSSSQSVTIVEQLRNADIEFVMILVGSSEKDALRLVREIKLSCEHKYVPLLLAGTTISMTTKLELLKHADEWIELPIEPAELMLRVQKHVDTRRKVLSHILVDPLTGAYNKPFLLHEIERQLNDVKRSLEPFTLVNIKIDELDGIIMPNQYTARDTVIKGLVDYIKRSVRPMDVLCRYKEDECILILPKTYREDAVKLMNRLVDGFSQIPFQIPDGEAQVTFSCVVLEFSDAIHSPETCLSMMQFSEEEEGIKRVIDLTEEQFQAHQKLLIAVIDDDRFIREMLKDQLQDIEDEMVDIEIKAYSNGEEFFEDPWHRQNQRYLLIIDRIMPKMDGLELLQKIRTEYDRKRYICLMLTSKDSVSDIAFAIQRGANDYVVKPFGLKELRARIRRLIRGSR
ncbi:response regulator [uncultured Brevibacillus sp.]|uniref:response regulator n=1 Tax=uncultured Brevibacillus sp. TaxID=169970 RepID=UPI0025957D5D|nr:response regulator [uncultured Brevibacillus sp.]